MRFVRLALCISCLSLAAAQASAQSYDENPSGRSLYALADVRLNGADGETSWLDGGFGKARIGGGQDGDWHVRPRAMEAALVWQPQLIWSLDATIAATAQNGQDQPVDLSEAFLRYRHSPIGSVRLSGRMGLFWPPVSIEHSGPAWSVTETITPSAINSWIGEEVKVVAAEGTVSAPLSGGRINLTAALFGFNDTSGTLLALRGWALHDEKATAFSLQPLPPLNVPMSHVQASKTSPVIELDHRVGFYAKLGWSSNPVKLAAFYYDNRGDPEYVNDSLQWGWRTRFGTVSAQLQPAPRTDISAQALTGSTRMGFQKNGVIWVDTSFRSAFLMVTQHLGETSASSVSGRVEAFGTRGRGSMLGHDSDEDGWAGTLAGRHAFGDHLTLLAEIQHIYSDRAERVRLNLSPAQHQTVGQIAARLTY
jgi:hypothetical protein